MVEPHYVLEKTNYMPTFRLASKCAFAEPRMVTSNASIVLPSNVAIETAETQGSDNLNWYDVRARRLLWSGAVTKSSNAGS